MHELGVFGKPIDVPKNAIFLRPHWKYANNRNGTRRYRQLFYGSRRAATVLIQLTLAYSSCVEHPVQRLFLAIAAHLYLLIYGSDASDAFTHIPGPYVLTFLSIDDQFDDWYRHKFGNYIDRYRLLPVLKALQCHPEPGRLWESLINHILNRMGFTTDTHDRTIHIDVYKHSGETIYLLRQFDYFSLAFTN